MYSTVKGNGIRFGYSNACLSVKNSLLMKHVFVLVLIKKKEIVKLC